MDRFVFVRYMELEKIKKTEEMRLFYEEERQKALKEKEKTDKDQV